MEEKKAISLKQLAESKTEGVQKTTQFQVDPRIIEIEPGFNARPIDRTHVEEMIRLANAPSAVHEMIRSGKVSAAVALEVVRKHGEQAGDVLAKEHEKAASSGKTKVTKKTLNGDKPTQAEIVEAARKEERERCAAICDEQGFIELAKLIRDLV